MRTRLANALRRIANRLSPPPVVGEPATPIEFMTSQELAAVISSRNDAFLLFWAKVRHRSGDRYDLDISYRVDVPKFASAAFFQAMTAIVDKHTPKG